MGKFLVLALPGDVTAEAVAVALARRHGPDVVTLVRSYLLTRRAVWFHRLTDRAVETRIRLESGQELHSGEFSVVLNRLRYPSLPNIFSQEDRAYAAMEWFALFLSWAASLPCPVVNPPTPRGLTGAERSTAEWLALAAELGIPVRLQRLTTDPRRLGLPGFERLTALRSADGVPLDVNPAVPLGRQPVLFALPTGSRACRVLVAGQAVMGAPTDWWAVACRQLAARSGCPLLEVHLLCSENASRDWLLAGADCFPCARSPGEIQVIVELLENLGASGCEERTVQVPLPSEQPT